MSSLQSTESLVLHAIRDEDPRFELLFKRNLYLEKEFARIVQQLREEKEMCAAKNKDLQSLNELKAKLASLQAKLTKATERGNEYHCQMQKAQAETLGLRRKINGVLGHIHKATEQDEIPGAPRKDARNAYERIYDENKLLKWKLSVIEGYLSGMFSEEPEEGSK